MNPNEIKKEFETAMKLGDAPIGKYFACTISKLTAKETIDYINQLEAEVEKYQATFEPMVNLMVESKSKAIKEFAERADKELLSTSQNEICADCLIMARRIVNNLKEKMVGENNVD